MKPIPLSDFGRDHWSLLGYIECRCVDNDGKPDRDHMRCNPTSHPQFIMRHSGWKTTYSTRLRVNGKKKPRYRYGHDDWDCAADLETAGLITTTGTGLYPVWHLTKLGLALASAVRAHKAGGGNFGDFRA